MRFEETLSKPKEESAPLKRLGRLVAGLTERVRERNPSNYERRQDKGMFPHQQNCQAVSANVCAQKFVCAQKTCKKLLSLVFFRHKIKTPNNSRCCKCF